MSSFTGTGKLIRFMLRRDRFLLPIWVLVIAYFPVALIPGIKEIWPTQPDRDAAVVMIQGTPAFTALLGKVHDSSLGGLVAWRGSIMTLVLGVIVALTVIRHTRTDEEAGRRELIGSTVVGRHAGPAAVLVIAVVADLVIGGLIGAGLIGQGEDTTGSITMGAQYAAAGILFAGIAAVCAQLTRGAGSARAILLIVLGAAFLLRMTGDMNADLSWLVWVSPVGWLERLEPFGGNNLEVLGLFAGAVVVLIAVAFVLQSRRDIEAGVLPTRPGRAEAAAGLANTFGLAWRLQRASLLGWSIGFAVMGTLLGSMVNGIDDMLTSSRTMAQVMARMGGSGVLTDAFVASMTGIMALAAAGYSIQATAKLRSEETAGRTEQVLATNVHRTGWAASHLAFAFVGPAIGLAIGAVGFGIGAGPASGDIGTGVTDALVGTAVQLPAVWVLTGLATLLFGVLPRLIGFAWVALTLCLLFGQLGAALQLPQWVLDLSPFTHVPQIPGHEITARPLLWLALAVVVTTVVGLVGFGRRDLSH